jgi:hypothetical protein
MVGRSVGMDGETQLKRVLLPAQGGKELAADVAVG